MTTELESLTNRIQEGMARQSRYYVSSPAEMAQLGSISEAIDFARKHNWMLVSHLGGQNYEFIEAIPSPHQKVY